MAGALSQLIDDPQLSRILDFARQHLGMSVAFVVEVLRDEQVYRCLDGDAGSFGMKTDQGLDLISAYCPQMLDGVIPNAIPDASRDSRVNGLAVTSSAGIGSYIGVPVILSDGALYGSFGCLSHEPVALGDRDVRFLEMLAELVAPAVEVARERDRSRLRVVGLIESGALDIALQPIFDLGDGGCLGVEALSRFPAACGSTDAVFEAARSVGQGTPLERLALQRSVAVLPQVPASQYLAVNASPEVAQELADVATSHPELISRLVLEITEHAAVDSYGSLRKALRAARDLGLRLAIDDAGAGYASLKHVVELEPDIIKIDRSLIHGVANDRARRGVVSAFVSLAKELGASVTAEGVEELSDLETVRDLGIDAAQGYLLARPTIDRSAMASWAFSSQAAPSARPRGSSYIFGPRTSSAGFRSS